MDQLALHLPAEIAPPEPLDRLGQLESEFLQSFVTAGLALKKIRDEGLFRARYGDFDTYCRRRWGMGKTYPNRLIKAAQVSEDLRAGGVGILPTNEFQCRPLTDADLNTEERRVAWLASIQQSGGSPTGEQVRATVEWIRQSRAVLAPGTRCRVVTGAHFGKVAVVTEIEAGAIAWAVPEDSEDAYPFMLVELEPIAVPPTLPPALAAKPKPTLRQRVKTLEETLQEIEQEVDLPPNLKEKIHSLLGKPK